MKTIIPTLSGLAGAILIFVTLACEKQSSAGDRESDEKVLGLLRKEIDSLSTLYPCTDPQEWHFTAIGAKACGGPTDYVAYSEKLDTVNFLAKVKRYTTLQSAYNKKWGAVSDCMFLTPPSAVICQEGKPKLIWNRKGSLK